MLWERLADLRPLAGLRHFELRFHQSLATTLSDAYKQMTTKKYGQYETLESETFIVEGTEVLEDISVLALATEEKATLTFESVLDAMSAAELQGRVGDPRHAEALRREIAGDSREEIAARLGCSVKTVYLWTESAKSVLKEYIEENYWPGRPER
jgi:DNA-directed RNA polymerase specialized sigma24 family protein